jgi:transcriptional regulator with XRE-family HTH domain
MGPATLHTKTRPIANELKSVLDSPVLRFGTPTSVRHRFSERVVKMQQISGMMHEAFGEVVGLSMKSAAEIEQGRAFPEPNKPEKITRVFMVPLEKLFDDLLPPLERDDHKNTEICRNVPVMAWKFQSVPLLAVTTSFSYAYRHFMGTEA